MQNTTKHVHSTMSFDPVDLAHIDERAERLNMTRSEYLCRCAKCMSDIVDDVFVETLTPHKNREEKDMAVADCVREEITHYLGLFTLEDYYKYRGYYGYFPCGSRDNIETVRYIEDEPRD